MVCLTPSVASRRLLGAAGCWEIVESQDERPRTAVGGL